MFFILLCFLVAIKINSCGRLSLNSYFSFNSSCAFLLLQRPEHPDRLVSACHDTAETTGKPHPPSTLTLSPGLASGSSHHNTRTLFQNFSLLQQDIRTTYVTNGSLVHYFLLGFPYHLPSHPENQMDFFICNRS